MFALALAALALQPPAPAAREPILPEPPEEMIDFLGRRSLCTAFVGGDEPEDPPTRHYRNAERARLQCSRIAGEERHFRERYAGRADVMAWLDRDPERFNLGRDAGMIVAFANDGPPPADVRRVEQRGLDLVSGAPYRVVVDADADGGRLTAITASYGAVPARTFYVDNRRITELDLQTLKVEVRAARPHDQLIIDLRFGHRRGYCADIGDDRPKLSVSFRRNDVTASAEDRANCGFRATDLDNARPRPARRR
jgi:hypothetical protein